MKKTILALAAVWLLASPIWAGGGLGFFGAWWDTDDADDDIGGGGILEFDLGDKFDLELRVTIFPDFEAIFVDPTGTFPNRLLEFETTALELGFAYNFVAKGAVIPYVGAGFGYYLFDLDQSSIGRIRDEGGWYAVAGVDFTMTQRIHLLIEAIGRNIKAELSGDDLGFQPVTRELKMNGVGVNFGFVYSW